MDLSRAAWRKSTRSNTNGACVEVADNLQEMVGVRDSKDPNGPALMFTRDSWREFINGVKAGDFE